MNPLSNSVCYAVLKCIFLFLGYTTVLTGENEKGIIVSAEEYKRYEDAGYFNNMEYHYSQLKDDYTLTMTLEAYAQFMKNKEAKGELFHIRMSDLR